MHGKQEAAQTPAWKQPTETEESSEYFIFSKKNCTFFYKFPFALFNSKLTEPVIGYSGLKYFFLSSCLIECSFTPIFTTLKWHCQFTIIFKDIFYANSKYMYYNPIHMCFP
jgi:hypothetical protein